MKEMLIRGLQAVLSVGLLMSVMSVMSLTYATEDETPVWQDADEAERARVVDRVREMEEVLVTSFKPALKESAESKDARVQAILEEAERMEAAIHLSDSGPEHGDVAPASAELRVER